LAQNFTSDRGSHLNEGAVLRGGGGGKKKKKIPFEKNFCQNFHGLKKIAPWFFSRKGVFY